MKINGTEIANKIYISLTNRIIKLKERGTVPCIAVLLIGNDPASESYISQKRKWSKSLGLKFSLFRYPADISNDKLLKVVNILNKDSKINGIIIQRPVPLQINKKQITEAIEPQKDVDGFALNSPFDPPVAKAVMQVLKEIFLLQSKANYFSNDEFITWLKNKSITILGKGETAGRPIFNLLTKTGIDPFVITSTTKNTTEIIKGSDIIISAVGKENIIKSENIKKKVILLGVGLFKGQDNKLHGDYVASKIRHKAAFYTPVTGGIGPVNVAFLLSNLIEATENQL